MSKPLTYISLFSSAGVGCFGFKQNGFECIATNEILTKRLKIQVFNSKCKYETGYLDGDISTKEIKNKLFAEIKKADDFFADFTKTGYESDLMEKQVWHLIHIGEMSEEDFLSAIQTMKVKSCQL